LYETASPLSFSAIGLRATAIGLLAGAAVATLVGSLELAPADLAPVEPWQLMLRAEGLVAVGFVLLICLLHGDVNRIWVLLGSGVAASTAWLGTGALEGLGVQAAHGTSVAPFSAALLSALLLSPGPTSRLVARVRKIAVEGDDDHVLLFDPAGHILHVSDSGRVALGIEKRRSSLLRPRENPPKAVQKLLGNADSKMARFRSPSGQILEARIFELGTLWHLRRTRAILLQNVTGEHINKRKLVQLAHYDSLTGLANRRLFLEKLKKTLESAGAASRRAALFYLDLDGFKTTNDSLGHLAGDLLLKAVAERLRDNLRPEEVTRFDISSEYPLVVARLSGDEFAVIAPHIRDAEAAGELARFMIDVIRRPLELGERTLSQSASIGIALFPRDGQDVETLLHRADSALYVAKSRGRQCFAWYEASIAAKEERNRLLAEGLQSALDREEMRLDYQPKVDTLSGELVGFEALLRWRNHELGDVGPAEFIPVAEARGLINKLGSWCLDEACRQLRAWKDAGFSLVRVSVNVSSQQFVDNNLQREVTDALRRHEVDPEHLELELTESLLLDEKNDAMHDVEQTLRDLRSIGVQIALDDFGTGYSALTYLNRFSLDVLKVDRSLLRNIDSDPSALGIVSSVVTMAHSLGLCVVAEGVDAEVQLPILQEMGCNQIQGFLFAPALPAEDVVRLMSQAGKEPVYFGPGMSVPGNREPLVETAPYENDEPVLRGESVEDSAVSSLPAKDDKDGRVLIIDDGSGYLGTIALRLGHLGIGTHYVSEVDEAYLFVAQEMEAIRLIAFPPTIDPGLVLAVRDQLTKKIGEERRLVVIGDRPDDAVRLKMRSAGVDWVLWAPFDDVELRYVTKSAMTVREPLENRRGVRVPVDLIANVKCRERKELSVVSSLSTRGAFLEMSEPFPFGSSLRIDIDLGGDRFRGFARVIHVQPEDPDQPSEPSGVGVTFYGAERDEMALLRKTISEIESRYLP
jgi:diguanylate cyclase (GGDEF)-like protein